MNYDTLFEWPKLTSALLIPIIQGLVSWIMKMMNPTSSVDPSGDKVDPKASGSAHVLTTDAPINWEQRSLQLALIGLLAALFSLLLVHSLVFVGQMPSSNSLGLFVWPVVLTSVVTVSLYFGLVGKRLPFVIILWSALTMTVLFVGRREVSSGLFDNSGDNLVLIIVPVFVFVMLITTSVIHWSEKAVWRLGWFTAHRLAAATILLVMVFGCVVCGLELFGSVDRNPDNPKPLGKDIPAPLAQAINRLPKSNDERSRLYETLSEICYSAPVPSDSGGKGTFQSIQTWFKGAQQVEFYQKQREELLLKLAKASTLPKKPEVDDADESASAPVSTNIGSNADMDGSDEKSKRKVPTFEEQVSRYDRTLKAINEVQENFAHLTPEAQRLYLGERLRWIYPSRASQSDGVCPTEYSKIGHDTDSRRDYFAEPRISQAMSLLGKKRGAEFRDMFEAAYPGGIAIPSEAEEGSRRERFSFAPPPPVYGGYQKKMPTSAYLALPYKFDNAMLALQLALPSLIEHYVMMEGCWGTIPWTDVFNNDIKTAERAKGLTSAFIKLRSEHRQALLLEILSLPIIDLKEGQTRQASAIEAILGINNALTTLEGKEPVASAEIKKPSLDAVRERFIEGLPIYITIKVLREYDPKSQDTKFADIMENKTISALIEVTKENINLRSKLAAFLECFTEDTKPQLVALLRSDTVAWLDRYKTSLSSDAERMAVCTSLLRPEAVTALKLGEATLKQLVAESSSAQALSEVKSGGATFGMVWQEVALKDGTLLKLSRPQLDQALLAMTFRMFHTSSLSLLVVARFVSVILSIGLAILIFIPVLLPAVIGGRFLAWRLQQGERMLDLVNEEKRNTPPASYTIGLAAEMVGREDRLMQLQQLARRGWGAIGVVGRRGVGKSRLLHELHTSSNQGADVSTWLVSPARFDEEDFIKSVFEQLADSVEKRIAANLGANSLASRRLQNDISKAGTYVFLVGLALLLFLAAMVNAVVESGGIEVALVPFAALVCVSAGMLCWHWARVQPLDLTSWLERDQAQTSQAVLLYRATRDALGFLSRREGSVPPRNIVVDVLWFLGISMGVMYAIVGVIAWLISIVEDSDDGSLWLCVLVGSLIWVGTLLTLRRRQEMPTASSNGLMRLVSAYRIYASELVKRLRAGALGDNGRRDEPDDNARVVICMDELDKIVGLEATRECLRKIKALFEIPGVYYFLSMAEDTLAQLQLGASEGKNEVDSALDHIVAVPPLDWESSLKVVSDYLAKEPKLIDAEFQRVIALVAFGVPRDLLRRADEAQRHMDAKGYLDQYLKAHLELGAQLHVWSAFRSGQIGTILANKDHAGLLAEIDSLLRVEGIESRQSLSELRMLGMAWLLTLAVDACVNNQRWQSHGLRIFACGQNMPVWPGDQIRREIGLLTP